MEEIVLFFLSQKYTPEDEKLPDQKCLFQTSASMFRKHNNKINLHFENYAENITQLTKATRKIECNEYSDLLNEVDELLNEEDE